MSTHPDNDRLALMNPEAAAALLGMSPKTLSSWRSTGRYSLPWVKCGKKVMYRRGDVEAFIASRTLASGSEAIPVYETFRSEGRCVRCGRAIPSLKGTATDYTCGRCKRFGFPLPAGHVYNPDAPLVPYHETLPTYRQAAIYGVCIHDQSGAHYAFARDYVVLPVQFPEAALDAFELIARTIQPGRQGHGPLSLVFDRGLTDSAGWETFYLFNDGNPPQWLGIDGKEWEPVEIRRPWAEYCLDPNARRRWVGPGRGFGGASPAASTDAGLPPCPPWGPAAEAASADDQPEPWRP